MNHLDAARSSLLFGSLSLVMALGLAACADSVVVTNGSDPSAQNGQNLDGFPLPSPPSPPAPSATTTPSDPVPPQPTPAPPTPVAPNAIAIRYAQINWDLPGGSTGSSSSGGGTGPDPNTLYLLVAGGHTRTCDHPFASFGCQNDWEVSIGIPPALQAVGVIALNDPQIISTFWESFGGVGANDCGGGGGTFWDGSLEIESIDGAEVVFHLAGTTAYDFDANGDYTALRCQ